MAPDAALPAMRSRATDLRSRRWSRIPAPSSAPARSGTLAAETALPINVVEEFSERLPFAEGTFDVVFARAVLHHTRDLELACSEMYRVLRPGGILVAAREHVISKQADLATIP